MKVGIVNIEPSINNTAYMQISNYYKETRHIVEWWMPEKHRQYDAVFCSSLFTDTDKRGIPEDVICGGTGFDVKSRLSLKIENSDLDYSIYPRCETSYLWFSRGCKRNCPWCVVHEKEGDIHSVEPKNLNPQGRTITVCDNSFLENPEWEKAIDYLKQLGQPCDIQSIDIRTITRKQAYLLSTIPREKNKRIKFAWDNLLDETKVMNGLATITRFIKPWDLMCYVLVGNSFIEQDLYRVNRLRELKVNPFVMPLDRKNWYQKTFARWVNYKPIFKSVTWEKYLEQQWAKEEKRLGRVH